MAQRVLLSSLSRGALRPCAFCIQHPRLACLILICVIFLLSAVSAVAQTSQFVYVSVPVTTMTSRVTSFSKDSTGALMEVGSPLDSAAEGGPAAIDGQGRFLFVLNPTSATISMYQIVQQNDPTVSLVEVFGSPFAALAENTGSAPLTPVCLATEKSGRFVYVGYDSVSPTGDGEIAEYSIDAANQQIQITDSTATAPGLVDCVADQEKYLYVGLKSGGTNVYSIGQLSIAPRSAGRGNPEVSIATDPQGRFFFDGSYSAGGLIESALISPADGGATNISSSVNLSFGDSPASMLVDGSGNFLYVTESGGVYAYPVDAVTGALMPSQSFVSQLSFRRVTTAADPQGPYIYSLQSDGIHAFEVGPAGALFEIAKSPFSTGSVGARGLAISGSPVQAVTGAVAQLFPPSQDFGTITVGQMSETKLVSLTNTGGLLLTLATVNVSGANAADFVALPNCSLSAVLQVGTGSAATCTISVTFAPTAAGPRQATLTTTDTAGTQTSQLTGTGVAAQSAVTLVPGSLSFPSTLQGVTSASQTVTLTNSGAATLHMASVLLSGSNPSDFALANDCSGAYAVNAGCSIGVTFSPLADGVRNASIVIADDAPGSTQTVALTGTGTGAPVARPGVTITPPAISFTAATFGTSSKQENITVTSSGNTPLHISGAPQLAGPNANDFHMSNGCTAAAYAVNQACTIGLTFTPSATGTRTAVLMIADDAPNSPQMVEITGNTNALLAVTAAPGGSLSETVTAGQTATYNLQLTPGFNGSVSFTCAGAPTAAACTVPMQMNVSSGTVAPFVVTVTTTGSNAVMSPTESMRPGPIASPHARFFLVLLCLLAGSMLYLMTFAMRGDLRGTGPRPRLTCAGAFAAFAALVICSAAGCGGGSSVAQSAPIIQPLVTPPGTSMITVTPMATTSAGVQLTGVTPIQLTLTVN